MKPDKPLSDLTPEERARAGNKLNLTPARYFAKLRDADILAGRIAELEKLGDIFQRMTGMNAVWHIIQNRLAELKEKQRVPEPEEGK